MTEIALRASTMCVVICITSLVMAIQIQLNSHFKERKRRRSERRRQDHLRVAEARLRAQEPGRFQAVAGGRAMGRTATTFAAYTAQAARQRDREHWTSTATSTQSVSLTQEDLTRAQAQMAGIHPDHVIQERVNEVLERQYEQMEIANAKAHREKREAKLREELAEPFWAWHERKEQNETKRVGSNDTPSRSTDRRVLLRDTRDGNLSDALAYSVRIGGVDLQSTYWENTQSVGMDFAGLAARANQPDNG